MLGVEPRGAQRARHRAVEARARWMPHMPSRRLRGAGQIVRGRLNFTDVIVSVDAKGTIEVGEKQKRMHAHMVVEIKHFSMIQLNVPVIRSLFKTIWNEICEQPSNTQYELKAMPYVDVQLLKQSNAMDIIKAYVRKSVGPVSTPDINL